MFLFPANIRLLSLTYIHALSLGKIFTTCTDERRKDQTVSCMLVGLWLGKLRTKDHHFLFRANCHEISYHLPRIIVPTTTDYRANCHECCLTQQTGVHSYRLNICYNLYS